MRRGKWRCQRKYGMRSRLFKVLPVEMAEAWILFLLSRTSGSVWVGEKLLLYRSWWA
jgi:hypothetical protein